MTLWVTVILLVSLAAYASNRISLQTVSLGIIGSLALLYTVGPGYTGTSNSVAPAFSGFASQALVAIVALMVLGKSLIVTGALQPVSSVLSQALGKWPKIAFAAVLIGGFSISGFLNDTPVVVMLLPILVGAAAQVGKSAGAMLMPMNYAVILGGMMTAIGTSTNLLVNAISGDNGGPRFEFFDFYLIALPGAVLGLVYLLVVAPRLLHKNAEKTDAKDEDIFLSSYRIGKDNKLVGRMLLDLRSRLGRRVTLRHLVRHGHKVSRFPTLRFQANDMLVLSGTAKDLHDVSDKLKLASQEPASETGDGESTRKEPVMSRRCLVSGGSPIIGLTIVESALELRFDVKITGLSEATSSARVHDPVDIQYVPVNAGDSLLLEGSEDDIGLACQMLSLIPVGEPLRRRATRDASIALGIFACVIAAAVSKVVPIPVSATLGVLACVITRVLKWEDIEQAVEWKIVLIVASSIALGDALVRSGTTEIIALQLVNWTTGWPVVATIALTITISGLLTNFVSNNAAAAIMTPLAMEMARGLQIPLEPMVLAVLFGANMCFLTPMAYQTNLLVMAAAGYRFNDFVKVGAPLFLLMVPALTASLSWYYL